ncbi:GNAT family N-acetyltransferase [Paenibacillus kobensis]|uniref:GNAT family N-acetyltransferase n=1 Tax=Paenibacillus kobensis TaxID=59841 RepID=UPI000FDAD49D|nr:GNAT family N-acetyltransferase [Paenibacillus kobensis]
MEIKVDDLTGEKIAELIKEHFESMQADSLESCHALDLTGLRSPEITFWSVWDREELLGCGALKELNKTHGEIKSMRTASDHLRKGVARTLLEHIIGQAKERGYTKISLETGSSDLFKPAVHLYERLGFEYCAPFEDYTEDPNSIYMTMDLGLPNVK